jgi:hypothetical protein
MHDDFVLHALGHSFLNHTSLLFGDFSSNLRDKVSVKASHLSLFVDENDCWHAFDLKMFSQSPVLIHV